MILASLLPCRGEGAVVFGFITNAAIALLFFLHGAKLSRQAIFDGIGNWRLHLTVLASSFVMFPLIGLGLRAALGHWVSVPMLDGSMLFAVPAALDRAVFDRLHLDRAWQRAGGGMQHVGLEPVLGMFVTPVLVGLLLASRLSQNGGFRRRHFRSSAVGGVSCSSYWPRSSWAIFPGRSPTKWISDGTGRWSISVDRGSILLVVYTAFSAAVVEGLWHRLSVNAIWWLYRLLDAVCPVLRARRRPRPTHAWLGFNRTRRDALSSTRLRRKAWPQTYPMVDVLFPAATVGPMIVPLMIFHQMQLMVCAVLARRYAAGGKSGAGRADPVRPASFSG